MTALMLALSLIACSTEGPAEEAVAEVTQPELEPKPEVKPEPAEPELSPEVEALLERLDPAKATETAPDSYSVVFETTEGSFTVEVARENAPLGADRLYNLVKMGFFEEIAFYRVIDDFMAQFGAHGQPAVAAAWRDARIQDDPVTLSNERGTLTFATAGKNTRTTQLFVNFKDNGNLDAMGFSPVGKVVEGMEVVDKLYSGYGEGQPRGRGPSQRMIAAKGNDYLKANFPELDYIKSAAIK